MRTQRWIWLLLILMGVPDWALATTYYVRPGFDTMRTPLTYGTGDGLSNANALAGFTTINSGAFVLAPGDIVCLPAGDEPFYGEQFNYQTGVAGTAGNPITFRGCGASKALLWSASDLTGDRSYNASKVAVNGAAYAWVTVAPNIYRKRIDQRPRVLWEDDTWLEPFWTGNFSPSGVFNRASIDALSEATIIATLPAGKWGNKNNGDGTFRLYYHATAPGKNPTNTTIRSNSIPLNASSLFIISKNYITVQDIEIRGHASGGFTFGMIVASSSHITLERMRFFRNQVAIAFTAPGTNISDILMKDCEVLDSAGNGVDMRGGIGSTVARFTVDGGNYSYTNAFMYNGTTWTGNDGDGIGLGFEGGTWTDFVIKNASFVGNLNRGILYGTNEVMALTNLTAQSLYMSHNFQGCFGEGSTNKGVRGTLLFSGVVCAHSGVLAGQHFYGPALLRLPLSLHTDFDIQQDSAVSRQVVMEHVTIVGSRTKERIRMRNDTNNHYHLSNIVFWENPGSTTSDIGDIGVYGAAGPVEGDDTFDHIYFSSAINEHRKIGFRSVGSTSFYYDVPGDHTAFTALLHGTDIFYNVDSLLAAEYRPQFTSPLRDAGVASATCVYADSVSCAADANPEIGAYAFDAESPVPPDAPTGLHLVGNFSNSAASIAWVPSSDVGLLGYKVYRGTAPGAPMWIATVTPATAASMHRPLTLYHARLKTAATYYFSVAAYNYLGTGPKSSEISVTVTGVTARTAATSRSPRQ